jgi:hypothetical protein
MCRLTRVISAFFRPWMFVNGGAFSSCICPCRGAFCVRLKHVLILQLTSAPARFMICYPILRYFCVGKLRSQT